MLATLHSMNNDKEISLDNGVHHEINKESKNGASLLISIYYSTSPLELLPCLVRHWRFES